MLAALTSRQIAELAGYYRLEPFGEERADFRSAQLIALLANQHRDPARTPQPFAVTDFMPFTRELPDEDQQEELARAEIASMKKRFAEMAERKKRK